MTTILPTTAPQWLAGVTYDGNGGNDLRNSDITAGWLDTGILTGSSVGVWPGVTSGAALKVSTASGMSVTVGPGSFVVPNSASPVAGGYRSTLASSGVLAVATADPSNPRIDIVAAWVNDLGTSSSGGQVQIYAGIPGASPSPPSAPANSVILAQIAVPAASTSVTSGNIADERTFTAASGGIVIAPKSGGLPAGYNGLMAFDPASGSFYHMSAAGARQAHVLPWAPLYQTRNADFGLAASTQTTILSQGITTDGRTDIKVTTHIVGLYQGTPDVSQVVFTVWLDGTQLDEIDLMTNSSDASGISHLGFTNVYSTGAASSDTPSSGSHTVYWKGASNGVHGVDVRATATRNAYLRVEPVVL